VNTTDNKLSESFHLESYDEIVYITFRHGDKRTRQQQFIANMEDGKFTFAFSERVDSDCIDKKFSNGDKIEAMIEGEDIIFLLNDKVVKNYCI